MPATSRRAFIAGSVAAAVAAGTRLDLASALGRPLAALPSDPFTLGVASGDPTPTNVILWTRLVLDPIDDASMPPGDHLVEWELAADSGFSTVLHAGSVVAPEALAHSVHLDVGGLEPDTWYWYRFRAGGHDSPVGRTRTAPPTDSRPEEVRFGWACCQSWTGGYYPAHHHLAQEDLDLVFHLGDYIYEGGVGSGVRPHNSPEVFTLPEYRNRYGLYKSDPNLQASHAAFPWVVIWDDHEVDNNYGSDLDEHGGDPADFLVRRAAAYQAWYEHQAVRLAPPVGPDLQIYRSLRWGDLASFYAIDTRQYRSPHACGGELAPPCPEIWDPGRTMLGAEQEAWLDAELAASSGIWDVIANQMVMSHLPLGPLINHDQWDAFPAARERLAASLAAHARNAVVMTGDVHASGIGDLVTDADSDPVGIELVTTSISSRFPPELVDLAETLIGDIDWVHYINARERGYVIARADREQMQVDYRMVETALEPTSDIRTAASWVVVADVDPDAPEPPGEPGEPERVGPPPVVTPSPTDMHGRPVQPGAADIIAERTAPARPASPVRSSPGFTG